MTRLEFFKRVAGLCGLSLVSAKLAHAVKFKPPIVKWSHALPEQVKMPYLDDSPIRAVRRAMGYTFRWTGVADNDWRNPLNWEILTAKGYRCSIHIPFTSDSYPGSDTNRLDNVIIPADTALTKPYGLAMLGEIDIACGGALYFEYDRGKVYAMGLGESMGPRYRHMETRYD